MKKVITKNTFIIVMICLLIPVGQNLAQESVPLKTGVDKKALISELEEIIPQLMKKAEIPGLSIAVIIDGKIIWSRGFGIKNTKTGESVTDDTIFEAASLTKPFFAYAAMKLVEKGELDLDTPLIKYAPQSYLEKKYIRHPVDLTGFRKDWFEKITARMVLSHSSGLPHGGPRKPLPILFEPGQKYRYSADGYMYLQRIIEHLKGDSLREIMRKLVIEPLKMKNSSMVWQEKYETQSAVGHDIFSETTGRFRKRKRAHAAASLYTTAYDYARFVIAMLNDIGLKKETVKQMLTPQIDVEKDVFWGLGFGLEHTDSGDAFWQWGDYVIFRNYIVAYKKQKIGVVYLTNSNNGLSIGPEIVKRAIGGGKELALAYLDYALYDSPSMVFVRTIKNKGIEEAVKLFHELRKENPDDLSEGSINSVGYTLLNSRRIPEAIEIFKLNVETFPNSANVYDSLAEAYVRKGDSELAIKYYKKTLEMIPKDTKADKAFLERLKKGALENLKKLEKKEKQYQRGA
ncbi:MAG: serine hydrolase [Candidatus Aminicenantes bacterium]|nr:MAG: serine hydrolase [Candidatus Aminicenantes bacterium]